MSRFSWLLPSGAVPIGFFLVGGVFFAIGNFVGHWLADPAAWALLVGFLLILGIGHVKFVRARVCRTQDLVRVLQAIAVGKSGWRRRWPGQAAMSGLGAEMRDAVEELSDSIDVLRREKRRAELVLASMSDGVISVGCDGRITLFNLAASSFFGVKEPQMVGKTLEEAGLHPEIMRLSRDCNESQTDLVSEITLPGHSQMVIRLHAAPYRSAEAGGECAIIVLHDLTETRRHERYQKEFASNVSHELRTPITAVRSTAETLLAGAKHDDKVADQFLNSIIQESDRLSVLIDDIMEVAKLDSGVAEIKMAPCKVADTVEKALTVLTPLADQKRLVLSSSVPEELTGYYDSNKMMRVVRNLVDNAIKYTPIKGSVEVGARADGTELVIWVRDTGIGIPHGDVDRIFTRFYRVDKARSRSLGGTGLGLSIVKEIVEAHRGRVSVDTELGLGSTFTVVIPGVGEIPTK